MKWLKLIAFLITGHLLSGCDSTRPPTNVVFPNIDFQCQSSQSSHCSATGHNNNFIAGITSSTAADCLQLLRASGSTLSDFFEFSSSATAEFTGLNLRATPSTWVDSSQSTVTELRSGTYLICAYLDSNGNQLLDSGEAVASKTSNLTLPDQLVNDWTEF